VNTNHISIGGGFTNIRPSHYFISIPRTSISYKATEMPQQDSIIGKNRNFRSISDCQMSKLKEFGEYGNKIKHWQSTDKPALPSQRQREAKDMSQTLRQYQGLKSTIAQEMRSTNYMNNRWRESSGKVINPGTYQMQVPQKHGLRAKAFVKYQQRHQEMLKRSTCTIIV